MKFSVKYEFENSTNPDPKYAWLEYAEPGEVYNYLKAYREEYPFDTYVGDTLPDDLEKMLLSRNEPLINVALATYSTDDEVCEFIYKNGSEQLKSLILAGPFLDNFVSSNWLNKEIDRLIEAQDTDKLLLVIQNAYAYEDLLTDFVKRGRYWWKLEQSSWNFLIQFLHKNRKVRRYSPRFETENYTYSIFLQEIWNLFDSLCLDEFQGIEKRRVIGGLWGLALEMRINLVSTELILRAVRPDFDIDAVISKWEKYKYTADGTARSEIKDIIEVLKWLKKIESDDTFREERRKYKHWDDLPEDSVPLTRELSEKISTHISDLETDVELLKDSIFMTGDDIRKHVMPDVYQLSRDIESLKQSQEKILIVIFALAIGAFFYLFTR